MFRTLRQTEKKGFSIESTLEDIGGKRKAIAEKKVIKVVVTSKRTDMNLLEMPQVGQGTAQRVANAVGGRTQVHVVFAGFQRIL